MIRAASPRLRVSRDLHDLLGHSLSAVSLKAGLAMRLPAWSVREGVTKVLRHSAATECAGDSSGGWFRLVITLPETEEAL